jgi:hypothetical protein
MRWLMMAALVTGCGTKTCKDETVLVSLTLSGDTVNADAFDVTVVVDNTQTLTAKDLPHAGTAAHGTLEI